MSTHYSNPPRTYEDPEFDDVEDPNHYKPGGFHPVLPGSTLFCGRYKILHKLGHGAAATIWLAQGQRPSELKIKNLVAIKILRADHSAVPLEKVPDISIPAKLKRRLGLTHSLAQLNIQEIEDHFFEDGPNGRHLCLVSPLAGPSINSIHTFPRGSARLRADLARKLAKQVANAVAVMHFSGFIHGDLSVRNVLFKASKILCSLSEHQVYQAFGKPETCSVLKVDDSPLDSSAPLKLVEPISCINFFTRGYLQEDALLIDFGQSFAIADRPSDYVPGHLVYYTTPESYFDSECTMASDVWCLACLIFEIRAGVPFFDSFLSTPHSIMTDVVHHIGKFPDHWWSRFSRRDEWIEENGRIIKPQKVAQQKFYRPTAQASIRYRLSMIGTSDSPRTRPGGPMHDAIGNILSEREIELLGDLLEKMLKIEPEERLSMDKVIQHPWFNYSD